MKLVIDTVIRQLEDLIKLLEAQNYPEYCRKEVFKLKTKLEHAKTPSIPPRVVWNKYVALVSTIEEAIATASTGDNELVMYSVINSIKEHVESFCSFLQKAYYLERLQIALPALVAFLAFTYRFLSENVGESWYAFYISMASLFSIFVKPIVGLVLLGFLGVMMLYLATSLMDSFLGVLLLLVSSMFLYVLYVTRSANFEKKLKEVSENIQKVVKNVMEVKSLNVDELLASLKDEYKVPDTGVFKFLDKKEMLRYKAVLMRIATQHFSAIKGIETKNNR